MWGIKKPTHRRKTKHLVWKINNINVCQENIKNELLDAKNARNCAWDTFYWKPQYMQQKQMPLTLH